MSRHVAGMGGRELYTISWFENLKGRDLLEDLGVEGKNLESFLGK